MKIKLHTRLLLSLGISICTVSSSLPSRSAEKVECGDNANVQVVNGVIVCTVEKKVIKQATCSPDNKRLERIPVYYTDPTLLKEVLDKVGVPCGSIVGVDTSPPALKVLGSSNKDNFSESSAPINTYRRRIADLDRPLERVNMEMWGIQISSADSSRLASVMDQVNSEINHTRKAMELAYHGLTSLARGIVVADASEQVLVEYAFPQLSTHTGPTGNQRISLPDVLARINLACKAIPQSHHFAENCNALGQQGKPRSQIDVYNKAANNLCNLFADQSNPSTADLFSRYNQFTGSLLPFRRPFQRFQEVALHQRYPLTSQYKCNDGNIGDDRKGEVIDEWGRRQTAVLDFLKQYNNSQSKPDGFNPVLLTASASQLDGLLSPIADALNQDIEEFFIRPTLHRIKKIVGQYRNVEYAEVGRTTLAGLNGLLSTVSSTISTSFDEPTPLRLNSLIETAGKLQPDVDKLFPTLQNVPLSAGNQINASSAVSLLAALSKEEVRWRSMSSGVTLKITPTVLRDRTAAQLHVDLIIADPATTNVSTSKDNPLRTLSRISNSTLQTKVRVNTMDLFALSSFNNQTTVNGRRWYVPLIGPIWEGIFGDIPVVGNLFSPLRPPINVQHQSIILTNTLIAPTAMGLTEWYGGDAGTIKNTSSGSLRSLSVCRSGARLDQFICVNGQWERN